MRSLNDKRPPLVGVILRRPIRCPECGGELVGTDTCVAIISDIICKRCDLIVIEIAR